jgi:hypothetical protein
METDASPVETNLDTLGCGGESKWKSWIKWRWLCHFISRKRKQVAFISNLRHLKNPDEEIFPEV